MKFEQTILKLLIENKNKEFTIRELSKLLKKDYKNTYDAIQKIKTSINVDSKGNASYISFKPILTNNIYQTEKIRTELIKSEITLIYEDIQNIQNPFCIMVLFGSYAKNKQTKNSDVDICIIHNNELEIKKIENKLAIHPKIEIHSFHYKEFIEMLKTKEFNVAHEILNDGIILKNIDSYYEVIKHGY